MISLTLYRGFISSISISIQFYICNVFDNHLEEFQTRLKSSMEYLLINFLAKPDSNYCISSFGFKMHTNSLRVGDKTAEISCQKLTFSFE